MIYSPAKLLARGKYTNQIGLLIKTNLPHYSAAWTLDT
jgi:hypothetical protein